MAGLCVARPSQYSMPRAGNTTSWKVYGPSGLSATARTISEFVIQPGWNVMSLGQRDENMWYLPSSPLITEPHQTQYPSMRKPPARGTTPMAGNSAVALLAASQSRTGRHRAFRDGRVGFMASV